MKRLPSLVLILFFTLAPCPADQVTSASELVEAVQHGSVGSVIEIAPGTCELESPLESKSGVTLKGGVTASLAQG
ncbi:hypothetical protein N9B73_00280 [Verrucomicrobiales bacterium]|nr:hypothetical protein [Verrucomicrobiales bacterium]